MSESKPGDMSFWRSNGTSAKLFWKKERKQCKNKIQK